MKDETLKSISCLSPEEIKCYIERITSDNQLYKRLLEIQRDGIIVVNSVSKILFMNKKANEILNFEIFDTLTPFYCYISSPNVKKAFEKSSSHEMVYREELRIEKDSRVKYISIIGLPFDSKYLYILSDITDRKKELYEFKRLESLAAISNVSSILAHDINNPLSAISIQAELIKRNLGKKDDEFYKEHLDIITAEIDRVKSIVRNFLYSAKPLDIVPILQSPEELLDTVIRFIKPELSQKSIKLSFNIQKPLPYIEYDFNLMHSVLINLIKNAIEAMENTEEKHLDISSYRLLNELRIVISDTGCGIPDNVQDDIFKPYFTTKKSGTGLGLSNVYKVVKMHGGDVRVEKNNPGARFIITLPVKKENSLTISDKN